ncbi:DUF6086 family protein [Streptomyces silvisoli]|uniref:DUF6086 family protein n=1 Tax=Streptomyces silvisoli TaxID=3034235 RepID=A0ABT5ZU64_9ACTN|nr:DUF6086 family protein [Streptomyces silvisoli]MDF3293276.1 DUF6086 family protein [Streptomyces silvisoli]
MSYTFEIDDEIVWGPANQVGNLYVGMINAVASTLKLPTGLEPNGDDLYSVDPVVFGTLVKQMLAMYTSSSHPYMHMLLDGVLPISLAMLERCGGKITIETAEQAEYFSRYREMDLPMTGKRPQ